MTSLKRLSPTSPKPAVILPKLAVSARTYAELRERIKADASLGKVDYYSIQLGSITLEPERTPHSCEDRKDPVDRMLRDCMAKEFTDWMLQYKSLIPAEAENVEVNLREQFKWHRLQGRIDQSPLLIFIATLWGLRGSVARLNKPKNADETPLGI